MTVIASFVVGSGNLPIGQLVREVPGMTLKFEQIVPTEDALMPYFWVTGGDLATFEERLAASPLVIDFDLLDRTEDAAFYRVGWRRGQSMLIEGIIDGEGAVLESQIGQEQEEFLVRFPDHDHLTRFHNFCNDHGINIEVQRVYTLTRYSEQPPEFGLTTEQREALVLATRHGYFSSPRATSLGELAGELGISKQATSQRIRGGTEKVMTGALGLARGNEE